MTTSRKRITGKTKAAFPGAQELSDRRWNAVRALSQEFGIPTADLIPVIASLERAGQITGESTTVSKRYGGHDSVNHGVDSPKAEPVKFAQYGRLYQIAPDATAGDVAEQIDERLDHAHGILVAIHGGGIEQFNACAETVQDEILSGLYSMVSEARELFGVFLERVSPKKAE
jgi:hypothetical protein